MMTFNTTARQQEGLPGRSRPIAIFVFGVISNFIIDDAVRVRNHAALAN